MNLEPGPSWPCKKRLLRLRFWIIKRLARGDLILLNAAQVCPPTWRLELQRFGQAGLVSNNIFYVGTVEAIPGTTILEATTTELRQ